MRTSEELKPYMDLALSLLDAREEMYGDSWKRLGLEGCFEQVMRKAQYLRVQKANGRLSTEKATEDLGDLMNWCAATLWHLKGAETNEASS